MPFSNETQRPITIKDEGFIIVDNVLSIDFAGAGVNGSAIGDDATETISGAGTGDMVLADAQTNSGIKTFLDTTMKLRNVADTFDGYFVNTNTANRIYTLQNRAGILADDTDLAGYALVDQTMYIGTTAVVINRASAALTLAGITLTTPDIGTPSAGILTSCTGLPYSGLANGTDGELITWDANGVIATVAVGTAAQVLTSNGVGVAPTFQDAAGGGTTKTIGTSLDCITFTTGTKTAAYLGGSGAVTVTRGLELMTGATDSSYAMIGIGMGDTPVLNYDDSPQFEVMIGYSSIPAAQEAVLVIVSTGALIVASTAVTAKHIGFLGDVVNGVITLYASNANGTTQTTVDVTADSSIEDLNAYRAVQNGTTDIKFYSNKTLSSTSTTNLPAGAHEAGVNPFCQVGMNNDAGEVTDWRCIVHQINWLVNAE